MNDEQWPRRAEHPTEPIPPQAAAPPPGFAGDPVDPEAPSSGPRPVGTVDDWQQRYEEQARRTRIFMATTVAAAAALVGSLFFAAAQAGNAGTDPAGFGTPGMGRFPGPSNGAPPGMGHHGGIGDGPGGFDDRDDFDQSGADFDDDDDPNSAGGI